jgi:hypothetical protein
MTLHYARQTLTLIAFLSLVVAGCNDSEGRPPPDVIIDLTGDGGVGIGCTQPIFPSEQPDISPFFPPEFVTETGEEQRLVRPGQELLAEVTVNGATRQVFIELSDAWSPQVILTEELDTPGNETIPVTFLTNQGTLGRFYLRLTLCGLDCDEREVVFDIIEYDEDDPTMTGINGDYERTLIEDGEVVRVDQTCVRPNSVLIQ